MLMVHSGPLRCSGDFWEQRYEDYKQRLAVEEIFRESVTDGRVGVAAVM